MTVHMPDSHENILSMERFRDLLASVSCTQTSMDLTFKDASSYTYAKKVWEWVNNANHYQFTLVAGAGDCQWNQDRMPFVVIISAMTKPARRCT